MLKTYNETAIVTLISKILPHDPVTNLMENNGKIQVTFLTNLPQNARVLVKEELAKALGLQPANIVVVS